MADRKSISTNGANRPTQRPRVRNVWRCHWLSKGRAKTKQIMSQTWAFHWRIIGWLKMEPGDYQTFGGASRPGCLEWRAFKQVHSEWLCR